MFPTFMLVGLLLALLFFGTIFSLYGVGTGALDKSGNVIRLLPRYLFIFSDFKRRATPSQPLSMNCQRANLLTPEYEYAFQWNGLSDEQAAIVDQYCTPEGRIHFATSVWSEDIVGHVSTAEEIEFTVS